MPDFPELFDRTSLPDPLRVLIEELPRAGWERHPNFGGLVQFWLSRHLDFRAMHGQMLRAAHQYLDGKLSGHDWQAGLRAAGNRFLDELHGHHMIEDFEYFPVLADLEPRLSAGFDMLERDHQALDGLLDGFRAAATAALRAPDPPHELAGRFLDGLHRLGGFLERHLIDEEDLVVPVVLKSGLG